MLSFSNLIQLSNSPKSTPSHEPIFKLNSTLQVLTHKAEGYLFLRVDKDFEQVTSVKFERKKIHIMHFSSGVLFCATLTILSSTMCKNN